LAHPEVPYPASRVKLSPGGSILLDILRFGAACTVLLSHFGHPGISVGFPNLTAAGHLAVAAFFVLSGFVIRYVTLTREASAREYLIDRISRVYSVVVPALAMTLLCELAAWKMNPRYYALVRQPFQWHDVPFQIGINLVFQAEDWGYATSPLSNSPFWSLSFECLYYAVYGLIFYRVRGGELLCFLLFLISGPSIALMFPVWLLGCLAFDAYQKLSKSRTGVAVSSGVFASMVCFLLAARVRIRGLLVATDDAHRGAWLQHVLLHAPHHELLYADGQIPWLTRASASFFVVGFATAVFVTWALVLLDTLRAKIPAPAARWIRLVANSTFTLYLLHMPVLIVLVCVLGRPIQGLGFSTLVLALVILSCAGLAIYLDAFKRSLRLRMERIGVPRQTREEVRTGDGSLVNVGAPHNETPDRKGESACQSGGSVLQPTASRFGRQHGD
jgi:peptidoglycan/LPS O-acetylase OafA/YrhL